MIRPRRWLRSEPAGLGGERGALGAPFFMRAGFSRAGAALATSYGKACEKGRPAAKDLCGLWQAVHLAQEMGGGLGGGALLLAAVQGGAGQGVRRGGVARAGRAVFKRGCGAGLRGRE